MTRDLLDAAARHAADYLESLPERHVGAPRGVAETQAALQATLPDDPVDPRRVLDELVAEADPGITAMGSPRYFGFVIGGAYPAAIAADWMASAWDQNSGLAGPTPSVAAIEEITGAWLLDLLGLPEDASFALVTGCQMAHVTALAAARHRLLAGAGWDVEADGLIGAPPLRVLIGRGAARDGGPGAAPAGARLRLHRAAWPSTTAAPCAPTRSRRRSPPAATARRSSARRRAT